MSDEDLELKILSNEELEAGLEQSGVEPAATEEQPEETEYEGPEKRSGKERRVARDRRDMLRFEPEKEKPDRRGGKDRRKENRKPEDLWHFRDF
jgi:hypothetical protein